MTRRRVGALIEQPGLYPDLSGRENLRLYAVLLGLDNPPQQVDEILKLTAEKGKAELAEVTAQLTKVAQASADYDRLQAEIAVARQWTEKEKQLPVAREKKAAAAQRVLELDTELETIEAEIAEAREELAQEQSKTVTIIYIIQFRI